MWLGLVACAALQEQVSLELPPVEPGCDAPIEPSGLEWSPDRRVFWTHGDGPDCSKVLAAYDGQHQHVGTWIVSLPAALEDSGNPPDVEDIALDGHGGLWLGDFGNNVNDRTELRLYRFAEPDPWSEDRAPLTPEVTLRFRYANYDGKPKRKDLNYDAGALFWEGGELYVLTLHRSDQKTTLYRVKVGGEELQIVEPIGAYDVGGPQDRYGGAVHGADVHHEAGVLAVLAFHGVYFFDRPEAGQSWLSKPRDYHIDLVMSETQVVEGITWRGSDLVLVNDGGDLFFIRDALNRRRPFPSPR